MKSCSALQISIAPDHKPCNTILDSVTRARRSSAHSAGLRSSKKALNNHLGPRIHHTRCIDELKERFRGCRISWWLLRDRIVRQLRVELLLVQSKFTINHINTSVAPQSPIQQSQRRLNLSQTMGTSTFWIQSRARCQVSITSAQSFEKTVYFHLSEGNCFRRSSIESGWRTKSRTRCDSVD